MNFGNDSRGKLDKLIYMNNATIRRDDIIARLEGIAEMEGEARDNALREYYLDLYRSVHRDAIAYRQAAGNDLSILKEGQNLFSMSAQHIFNSINEAFNTYFEEKGIIPCDGQPFFGTEPTLLRDAIYGVCDENNALESLIDSGRNRKIDLLNEMRKDYLDKAAASGYKYAGEETERDMVIAQMYVMHEERAAQFSQRGIGWFFRHPIEAIKTSWFLRKTEKALKQVGFDKATHGVEVKERFSREPLPSLKEQKVRAKNDCKDQLEARAFAEWRKANPILNIARDKYEKAKALRSSKENPVGSFLPEVAHILKKYDLSPDKEKELSSIDMAHNTIATDFDIMRDTSTMSSNIKSKFFALSRTLLEAALEKDGPVDIKQLFRDVNEFMTIEFRTFSVLYDREEFKDIAKTGMLRPESAEFTRKKLIDMVKGKRGQEEVAQFEKDIKEAVEDLTKNSEARYDEVMESLASESKKEDLGSVKEHISLPELNESPLTQEMPSPIVEEPTVTKDSRALI